MVFLTKKEGLSALPLAPEIQSALERDGLSTVGGLIDALEKGALPPLEEEQRTALEGLAESLETGARGYILAEWGAALSTRRGKLIWSLDEDGVLTIRGTGAMPDCIPSRPAPWQSLKESIKVLRVEEGVTEVGAQSFRDCAALRQVSLAPSVERVGMSAFRGCAALTEVTSPRRFRHVWGTRERGKRSLTVGMRALQGTPWARRTYGRFQIDQGVLLEYFGEESQVVIPEGVREIAPMVFENRPVQAVALPQSLEIIRRFAFQGTALEELILPAGVKRVEEWAFAGTKELCALTLGSEATELSSNAFAESGISPRLPQKRRRWPSLYGLTSVPEKGMGGFRPLRIRRILTRQVGVETLDVGAELRSKMNDAHVVRRLCVDEERRRVRCVRAYYARPVFSVYRDQMERRYLCIVTYPRLGEDGEIHIRDREEAFCGEELFSSGAPGLWPPEKGNGLWYATKDQHLRTEQEPVALLKRWLKNHPEYTLDPAADRDGEQAP